MLLHSTGLTSGGGFSLGGGNLRLECLQGFIYNPGVHWDTPVTEGHDRVGVGGNGDGEGYLVHSLPGCPK